MKHIDFVSMRTSERLPNGQVVQKKLSIQSMPENWHLYLLQDIHIGNASVSESAIDRAINEVRSKKHSFVAFQGDQLETIAVTDKRYDISVHGHRMARFDAQRDSFMDRFDGIADRVLWLLDGNHERRISNIYLPNKDIAEAWDAVYANGTLVKALFNGWRMASWHGAGSINSRAGDALQRETNQLIALKRNMRGLPADDCDVLACGHYHQCLLHQPTTKLILVSEDLKLEHRYSAPGRVKMGGREYRMHEDDRWYMCGGAFLLAYSEDLPGYAEDRGLHATELGYGHIEVKNGRLDKVEVRRVI